MRTVPLVIFGCVHLGADTTDLKMLSRYIEFVRRTPGALALLLSDTQECAVPRKAHMMFEQKLTPQKQWELGVELFRPIAQKIIGACTGNHANRAYHDAGIEIDRQMALTLGYASRYTTFQGFTNIKVGDQRYRIAFKHGSNIGTDVFKNCRQLLTNYPSADVCAASHSHILATMQTGHWVYDKDQRHFQPVTLVSTGSLLDYPRYADEAGYAPQPKGFAVAYLSTTERRIAVDVSGQI